MKLAMYKGPPTDNLWHWIAHWFTCAWTFSRYSHVELVVGGPDANGLSVCMSSSARDGGVRFKRIDLATGRWDVFELELDHFQRADAYAWFYDHAGAGYDWFGLLWFLLPIKAINSPKRWFCSESIAAALDLPKPHKFHPQRLLDAMTGRSP